MIPSTFCPCRQKCGSRSRREAPAGDLCSRAEKAFLPLGKGLGAFFLTEFRNALGKMAGEAAGTETLSLPRRGREDGPGCLGPVL